MKNKKLVGILFVLGAAFSFTFMNLFVSLSGDVPTLQKVFFRNCVACILAFAMIIKQPSALKTIKGNEKTLFFRSFFGLMGVVLNFYALSSINITDASLLNKLSPFFAMIFSIFILKEKVKKFEWGIVVLAFIGAIFVIKPTFSVKVIPYFAGFLSGMFAGLAYTLVRKATKNDAAGAVIVFAFSSFSSIVILPFVIFNFAPMTTLQWVYLILAGVSAAGGQFCITFAYKFAPAKEISVFDYTQVLFAAIVGFLVLNQIPDLYSFIGYFIIITAAVIRWQYNLKKRD